MNQKSSLTNPIRLIALALLLISVTLTARAVPYASGITNNGGNISFILNESADNVKIIFDGGGPGNTNNLGAVSKGVTNFLLGAHTSWQIQVTKSTSAVWTQISDDLNPLVRFFAPRGIAVQTSPADLSRFGRIYVSSTAVGTTTATPTASNRATGKGFYILNADQSDTFGYGGTEQTSGITFNSSASSPFKIELGEDGKLYIADYSNPNCTVFRCDADVTLGSSEVVLAGIGFNVNPTVHTDIQGSAIAKGSLANGNLVLWAIDGQYGAGNYNRLMRWDINSGPLPHNTPPTLLGTGGNGASADIWTDLDVAPDGKFFICQFRANGSGGYDVGRVNIRVYDTNGTTLLWDSFAQSTNALGNASGLDIFVNARAIKVSPDNKRVAMMRDDAQVWLIGLTNGVPNIADRTLMNFFGATASSSNGKEVSWDAAGNLYVANTSHEKMRVWSPGGSATAITKSDGTFQLVTPPAVVNVSATVATANEQGPTTGQFTVTRSGDLSSPLTVDYTMGGTATANVDYTNNPPAGSVTFAPGSASTNITLSVINDTEPEFTETAIFTISGSINYGIGTGSATVSILDNETPQIAFNTVVTNKLLESYSPSKATLQVSRRGLLATNLTVNLSYSGTATRNADYSGANTVSLASGAATVNLVLTPINDQIYEGTELAVVSIAGGTGYNVGTNSSAYVQIIDDEYPTGTVFFSDDFNGINSSNLWVVNVADPNDGFVEFNYDYASVGIPVAPGTTDGTRLGTRFRCGNVTLQTSAVSMSPLGGNFSGNYRLKFDMWINYNGPMPDGGPGSTQNFDAGVGTAGNQVVWLNNPFSDSVWFSTTGDGADGNTGGDYDAFIGPNVQNDDTGFYAAGTGAANSGRRNASDPFYAFWGGQAAPAAQLTLFPTNQTGVANVGNAGMAWHTVVITKATNVVVWAIDGITICTVTNDPTGLGPNVFVGYQDIFATGSLSDKPELSFGLVDNLRVEAFVSAPIVITSIKVVGGNVEVEFTGPPENVAADFTLQSSGTAGSGYGDVTSSPTDLGSGSFRLTRALSGGAQFYRIKL